MLGSLGGLAAIGVAGGLTACDTDDLQPPSSGSPNGSAASSAPPGARTGDEQLVTEAVGAIQSTVAVVAGARRTAPLRRPLGPLLRDHRRHLDILGQDPTPTTVGDVPAVATSALSAVHTAEQSLQAQLVGFSVLAQSGTLAALLGSMSASIAQHLAVLDAGTTA